MTYSGQSKNLIAGEWVGAASGKTEPVTDPATDEVLAEVPRGSTEDVRDAIGAAQAALGDWRQRTALERGRHLRRLAELMLERREVLGELMTREQGKPLAESTGEIAYAASFIDWAAEEGKRLYGETVPAAATNKRIMVLRQPVGVTASITPWNFPSAMIARKLGPALAVGCTLVIKPAMETPLSALALGELAMEAGIPAGVLNIITGDAAPIGDELLGNPTVRKLSFTGSTEVGKILVGKSAQNLTRLSLELGGHAPFIVFEDADVEAAVKGAMASKFRNMGQTCICANRFYVHDAIYDRFVGAFRERVEALKLGRGLDEGVEVGPLVSDEAVAKVEDHVDDARAKGAKVLVGGERATPAPDLKNRFYRPTILEDVDDSMRISREETFGPVAPIRRFRHDEEAVSWANDSQYGLAAYFYTRDASRLMRVAEALEYGIVGANDGAPSVAQAPFGGVKQSGYGREGGKYVMDEYTDLKYVSWGILGPARRNEQ